MLRFFSIFYFVSLSLSFKYSREMMQKNYPGFGTQWIPLVDDQNNPVIGYYTDVDQKFFTEMFTTAKDYIFYPKNVQLVLTLYTRKNPRGTVIKQLDDTIFDKNKPVKIVTHGWLVGSQSGVCQTIMNGFLQKYDANVFTVDWHHISKNPIYKWVVQKIRGVGKEVSSFLNALVKFGVNPLNIHLVGHSLGAHVFGFAARSLETGKIGRITGLDPAGPYFLNLTKDERLSNEDAEFVDVIHTSGKYLGLIDNIGDVDLYPNGGSLMQPTCSNSMLEYFEACCHSSSWLYFAQSLTIPKLYDALSCKSLTQMEDNLESCEKSAMMMGDPLPSTVRGIYYLFLNQTM